MIFTNFYRLQQLTATSVTVTTVVAIVVGIGTPARAFQLFFGEDTVNPQALTNSAAAEAKFLSHLVGVGTEVFEGFSDTQISPIVLSFPGAGEATLLGQGGIRLGPFAGRFSISGEKYWQTTGSFSINFSKEIAAFGFYGTDIGDYNGQVTLLLENTLTNYSQLLTINNTINAPDGSALYYGLIAEAGELFNKITFGNTNSGNDYFGFDDMTIGAFEQVDPEPIPKPISEPIPEPASLLSLMAVGALGTFFGVKRKLQK